MTLDFYQKLCSITNETLSQFTKGRDTCVLSSAALDETLTTLKIPHRAARLCLAAHHEDRNTTGVVIGSEEPWPRQKSKPGTWAGHLGVIAEDRFLLDPTQDQLNEGIPDLQASPAAYEVPDTFLDGKCLFFPAENGWTIRYHFVWRQKGWLSAPDWKRKGDRKLFSSIILHKLHGSKITLGQLEEFAQLAGILTAHYPQTGAEQLSELL
jgi:hypothetical protein